LQSQVNIFLSLAHFAYNKFNYIITGESSQGANHSANKMQVYTGESSQGVDHSANKMQVYV